MRRYTSSNALAGHRGSSDSIDLSGRIHESSISGSDDQSDLGDGDGRGHNRGSKSNYRARGSSSRDGSRFTGNNSSDGADDSLNRNTSRWDLKGDSRGDSSDYSRVPGDIRLADSQEVLNGVGNFGIICAPRREAVDNLIDEFLLRTEAGRISGVSATSDEEPGLETLW